MEGSLAALSGIEQCLYLSGNWHEACSDQVMEDGVDLTHSMKIAGLRDLELSDCGHLLTGTGQ